MDTRTAQSLRFLSDVTSSALVGWPDANSEQREQLLSALREQAGNTITLLATELEREREAAHGPQPPARPQRPRPGPPGRIAGRPAEPGT